MDCNNFTDVFILIAVLKRDPYHINNVTETTWNVFNASAYWQIRRWTGTVDDTVASLGFFRFYKYNAENNKNSEKKLRAARFANSSFVW